MHDLTGRDAPVGGNSGQDRPCAIHFRRSATIGIGAGLFGIEEIGQHHRIAAAMLALAQPDVDVDGVLAGLMQDRGHVAGFHMGALAAEDAMHFDMTVRKLTPGAVELHLEPFPGRIGAQACS